MQTEKSPIRIITVVSAVLLAIASFEHGLFETLQGNKPTDTMLIQAIGESMQWWESGGEEAFTVIPNFLVTGILTMSISLFIMIWAVLFLHRVKRGVLVLFLLFVLVTLTGGGIGFIPFYITVCAYGSGWNKPLPGWRKLLKPEKRKGNAQLWKIILPIIVILWLVALELAIFGWFPGNLSADVRLAICWGSLFASFILYHFTYVSGYMNQLKLSE